MLGLKKASKFDLFQNCQKPKSYLKISATGPRQEKFRLRNVESKTVRLSNVKVMLLNQGSVYLQSGVRNFCPALFGPVFFAFFC